MVLSEYLVTDDLTIILGLVAAGLLLLHSLYKPQSLVHPILLGRQSDVARVRNPKESAVYRNYSTGIMGRFPLRPSKDQHVLIDLVKPDSDSPRTLWSTKITNKDLRKRVSSLGTGLIRVAGLERGDSNVLLLLNDGIEFLISDLALASNSIPSFTLTSLSLLSPVLDDHPPTAIITHAYFLPQLLELIYDTNESSHHTIIVVGEPDAKILKGFSQVKILKWDDIEKQGAQLEQISPVTLNPKQVFTVSFHAGPSGELRGAQFTHENLTAGVAATRALVPVSGAISALDTIASAHSLSTGFGRAVAYTALYEGTNFATLASSELIPSAEGHAAGLKDFATIEAYSIPSPTILFGLPSHLTELTAAVLDQAKSSSFLLHSLAWRHKFAGVLEGFITKQSLWDTLVFDSARKNVFGKGAGTIRAVIISGGPVDAQILTPSRIALSVPLVISYAHPQLSGPALASNPLDLQVFPTTSDGLTGSAADDYAFQYLAPVGPPSVNVEAKLLAVDDDAVEGGKDPVGNLLLRGPTVGALLGVEEDETVEDKGWILTGERAKVLPNGAFKVAMKALKK